MDDTAARRLIAEQLAVSKDLIIDTAEFRRHLGADSLDLVSLTMLIEERFDVEIREYEAERCATVGGAIALLREKAAAAG